MRRAGGELTITSPNGVEIRDTFTCFHCNRVVIVPLKADPVAIGGMCYQCMKLVCPGCVALGTCTPFEKKLDAMERRADALRSYGE
jgi:hypothetical protein